MLHTLLLVLSLLTGSDTSLSCMDAKVKMGSDFGNDPVYFVINDTEYLAHLDDAEAPWVYAASELNLTGKQTLNAVIVYGERHPIANPLTVDCGGQQHTIFMPIIRR